MLLKNSLVSNQDQLLGVFTQVVISYYEENIDYSTTVTSQKSGTHQPESKISQPVDHICMAM